mmetsp:Transcript_35950/g.44644  ORF Transcript_35950/g.44644 Transcript_35950/m.44644 type:complete len:142 (+) Transcript_35950:414-839(+)
MEKRQRKKLSAPISCVQRILHDVALLEIIFSFADSIDWRNALAVCETWKLTAKSEIYFKRLLINKGVNFESLPETCHKPWRDLFFLWCFGHGYRAHIHRWSSFSTVRRIPVRRMEFGNRVMNLLCTSEGKMYTDNLWLSSA